MLGVLDWIKTSGMETGLDLLRSGGPGDYSTARASSLALFYCRSFKTDCGSELAWANMAVPDCTRMLYFA